MLEQISRRTSRQVAIGHILVGGDAPIMVQSMTNTDTENVGATVAQVAALALAGSEVVRITVNTMEAARAVPKIRTQLDALGVNVPLVGDFHSMATNCSPKFPIARMRWRSSVSIRVMSATAASVMTSLAR